LFFQGLDERESVVLSVVVSLPTPGNPNEREKTSRISQLQRRAHQDCVVRSKAASTLTEVACDYAIFEELTQRIQATKVKW
jgi:hypothetical protein